MITRRPLLTAGLALSFSLLGLPAVAQTAPVVSGPIRIVVPYGAGGGTDAIARMFAPEVGKILGTSVVVENRPGAGGIPGSNAVAKATPDGRTLLLTAGILVQAPALYSKLPYDVSKDFAPISVIGRGPLVLVGRDDLPGGSLKGFLEEAKKAPGKYNFGSIAVASTSHLYGEQLNRVAGVKVTHIPYNGPGAALTALISKEVDIAFLDYAQAQPHLKAGKIKALGINGTKRLGDGAVPTLEEQGLKGFETMGFYAVLAPAGTPQPAVSAISQAFATVANRPEIRQTLMDKQYLDAWGSTPEEFAEFMRTEMAAWSDIVKAANVKLD